MFWPFPRARAGRASSMRGISPQSVSRRSLKLAMSDVPIALPEVRRLITDK